MSRRSKQASMRSIVAMFADDRQNRDLQESIARSRWRNKREEKQMAREGEDTLLDETSRLKKEDPWKNQGEARTSQRHLDLERQELQSITNFRFPCSPSDSERNQVVIASN